MEAEPWLLSSPTRVSGPDLRWIHDADEIACPLRNLAVGAPLRSELRVDLSRDCTD
jgi:hypothetical protein